MPRASRPAGSESGVRPMDRDHVSGQDEAYERVRTEQHLDVSRFPPAEEKAARPRRKLTQQDKDQDGHDALIPLNERIDVGENIGPVGAFVLRAPDVIPESFRDEFPAGVLEEGPGFVGRLRRLVVAAEAHLFGGSLSEMKALQPAGGPHQVPAEARFLPEPSLELFRRPPEPEKPAGFLARRLLHASPSNRCRPCATSSSKRSISRRKRCLPAGLTR